MKKIVYFTLAAAMLACSGCKDSEPEVTPDSGVGYSDQKLQKIQSRMEYSRYQEFEKLRGKALVKGAVSPPISSTGVQFYRTLSYSLVDFAAKCFWLEEQNAAANQALMDYYSIYVENDDYKLEGGYRIMRDGDSFYWPSDELCRIIEYWGSNGSKVAGLLNKSTEEAMYKMMWLWAKDQSKVEGQVILDQHLTVTGADFSTNNTWDVEGSENHHLQRMLTRWNFAKLLKEHDIYKTLQYEDNFTASQHYDAWNAYIKHYFVERAKKGLFIEFGNDAYGMESLKGIYNFYDFGDTQLRSLAGKFLDLFWATWAESQINAVSGGSKARVYQGRESAIGATHFRKVAWFYFGLANTAEIKENLFSFLVSDYRVPLVVMDIALDRQGRGEYEITQRRLGLAEDGKYTPPVYKMNQTQGLVRYAYCAPEFIMGTFHCDALPESNWTMISSQNRWLGVVYEGDPNCRVFAQCDGGTNAAVYNQHWSAQSKGCMIVQKLTTNRNAGNMRVWISDPGITNLTETSGWVFVEAAGAYTAIKFAKAGHTIIDGSTPYWKGKWVVANDEYSPVIIEVGRKSDYTNYLDFQNKILALELAVDDTSITHKTIYGQTIKFFSDYSQRATVDGVTIDTAPTKVMNSPFIESDFDSGVYTIKKGSRSITLNFN